MAVVTGASAGVGRTVVAACARRGLQVGLIARGRAGLEAAAEEALALGAPAVRIFQADVADSEAVEAAADQFERELGPIEIWVNNAMVSVFAPVWEITAAEFKRVTEVDYLGYVHGTVAALGRMRPRDHGAIVQVGSALAYRGIPLQSAYCGAKHAVQGFQDSLRSELLHEGSGVRVSMVHLPAMNTPQFGWVRTRLPNHPQPVAPIYQPEIAAEAILWAAEHGPRELNVGAITVGTRAGNALAPGLLDRYLARTGVSGQQTDQPIDRAAWRDNLDAPLDDDIDRGAHGVFGDQAKTCSPQTWAATHKLASAGAVGLLAAVAAGTATILGRR